MSKSQLDGTGLLVAVAAAALSLNLFSGAFDWLGSICGLVLVFLLLSYDRDAYRTTFESLAFAGTVALCFTIAATIVLRILAGSLAQPAPLAGRIGGEWLPAIWLFVTVVFCLVDRARMSGRVPQTAAPVTPFPTMTFSPTPAPRPVETPVPISHPTPPQPLPLPVRQPVAPPVPQPVAPAPSPRAAFTQPAFTQPAPAPEPVQAPPPPPPVMPPPPPPPAPVYSAPPPPPPPPPQAVPIPAGKEATVYVTIIGEGLNVLRAVRAEHLGRDYYKIVEEMPPGEMWQYGPGQVVRCKKKNLSSGKAMVAFEEAQRAQ